MLSSTNVRRPKGQLIDGDDAWEIDTDDQLHARRAVPAADHRLRRADGALRLGDVADVEDSIEDLRAAGLCQRQARRCWWSCSAARAPTSSRRSTACASVLPQLAASLPAAATLSVVLDRTPPIRASLRDVELTLLVAVMLVILVVFAFLRNVRAALIPSVAVPVSLIGTFGVMYLCGYSLDNLSLMALTIATGFVVDDAIVVLENISRYIEHGLPPREAALRGAREIGFTVLSMSVSLVAVFIPILLMGGMVGRLFREFAVDPVGGDRASRWSCR